MLAGRAKVGTATADDNTLDWGAAIGAVLPRAVSNDKFIVGGTGITVGSYVIPYASTFFIESFP